MESHRATESVREGPDVVVRRGWLPWRGFALGLLGVAVVSLFTPYNNYPLNNTDFVGNHLPLGVVLLTLLLVVVVNGPLSRWAPRLALRRAELTVALSMTLVASAFPSVGLMRYLPGHLTSVWVHAAENPTYATALRDASLPDWLFPRFDNVDPSLRGTEDVARGTSQRTAGDSSTFVARVRHVPWQRWALPAFTWGAFVVTLTLGALLTAILFHRQWSDVERLPFPLAGVWAELIEPPAAGRWFNALLRNRAFWIAAATVFLLHGWNAMSAYQPTHFVRLPLSFKLYDVMAEPPLYYAHWTFKEQGVFFTVIGLMCFVRGRVSFSLWFFYVLTQAFTIAAVPQQVEITDPMKADQQIGATGVMALAVLWVSRRSLVRVGQLMFGATVTASDGAYGPALRWAGWGLAACLTTMVGFFVIAGVSVIGAIAIVAMLTLVYLVLARVIAETGMVYVLLPIEFNRPMVMLTNDLPASLAVRTPAPDYFHSLWTFTMLAHDTRQAMPGYATSATRLAEPSVASVGEGTRRRSGELRPIALIACLLVAIVSGYVLSGAATLYVRYNYPVTLDRTQGMLDNNGWGSYVMPQQKVLDVAVAYAPPRTGLNESHWRPGHVAFGSAVTAALYGLRLRFAAWPLDPIGFLLCYTWGVQITWFSILIGWTTKALTVRFGGAPGLAQLRVVALGLIVGETFAAAFWVLVSFAVAMSGYEHVTIRLLPS